jgi:hypothetical protein
MDDLHSDSQWAKAGRCAHIFLVKCDGRGKHVARCGLPGEFSVKGKRYCREHADELRGIIPNVAEPETPPSVKSWRDEPPML